MEEVYYFEYCIDLYNSMGGVEEVKGIVPGRNLKEAFDRLYEYYEDDITNVKTLTDIHEGVVLEFNLLNNNNDCDFTISFK